MTGYVLSAALKKKCSMSTKNQIEQISLNATVQPERSSDGPYEPCQCLKPADSCIILIFGASGDLTSRKIIPALFNLYLNGSLPDSFVILGCARTKLTNENFRDNMKAALDSSGVKEFSNFESFAKNLYYQSIDYNDLTTFRSLANLIKELDKKHQTAGNILFYLAVPPLLYETVANMIGQARYFTEAEKDAGWSRIVVEKPFGSDLKTSLKLNSALREIFQEHQIYRIDHYLAKETVQNILVFRFANSIFEPIWNRQYIDYVDICAAEILGVEHRVGYYEKAGVLRDMFQNHMMQLLTLIAMEPPANFLPEMVRDEKAKLIKSLKPFEMGKIEDNISLGQYTAGIINGKRVPAYRDEPGVASQSLTPTFARLKVFIDNWRWQGVPFYMMSGKRLAEKITRIIVQFKDVPHSIFRNVINDSITANRLTFFIQPNEKISLRFQAKNPGSTVCLRPMNMEFSYNSKTGRILEAYEKVLIDCMLGDQMLFLRQDSEELCWSFLTPILEDCEECMDKARRLHFYEAGSWGPASVNEKMNMTKNKLF